jgi:hypothetical protein
VRSTWTNAVRFAVAALLGVAACLIAWWPQSAAGTGRTANLSQVAAAPTQSTPTPVQPTAAPPPPPPPSSAPPPAQPTKKPTHKPTPKPTRKPTTLHNDGGSHPSGHQPASSHHQPSPSSHPTSGGSTSAPYVPPTHSSAPPTKAPTSAPAQPATKTPSASPPTETAAAATAAAAAEASDSPAPPDQTGPIGPGDHTAAEYEGYLSSSEPVQTASAPVWVVPGILLVLTSMLAVLGGVLGRGSRPALARARASQDDQAPDAP